MSRRLRFIPPDSLVEVTCRTVQGRLLLSPTPMLRDLTLGVLARAARLYPVELHAFAFLSNHFHLLLTVRDAQRLASFMNYLNSNLAREAGRLIRWREKFWGRRYQAILVSDEEEAQIARLRYLLAHGVKEGLVGSPLEWPGAHCVRALLDGTPIAGRWFDRTLEYAACRKRLPTDPEAFVTVEELHLTPLPCWRDLPGESYRARIRELVGAIEHEALARERATGKPPLGRDALFRQDPRQEPNRIKKGPAPLGHAASRAARDALREAYRIFVGTYRRAADRLRSGVTEALFPDGSFPPPLPFRLATAPG
ncbi:MAG TPA: transposase [Thermoanaerobaculia bacterium]|jgi:REP element-mobilizing transposase RayT